MQRIAILTALLLASPALARDLPSYGQVAKAPGAWKGTVKFTLRFQGLKECDGSFAALGRNASTHVQITEPGFSLPGPLGKQRLPMFVRMGKSYLIKKLRMLPTGVTYEFTGRMRYFKKAVYTADSFNDMDAESKASWMQSAALGSYYNPNRKTDSSKQPEAAGYSVHHLLDVYAYRELKTKPTSAAKDRPKAARSYQKVDMSRLSSMKLPTAGAGSSSGAPAPPEGGIPVKFKMPYLGMLADAAQQQSVAQAFAKPKVSCVKESDLEDENPGQGMKLISPPGPLSKLIVIAFGANWDVAKDLQGLKDGDMVEISGVLKQAPEGTGAKMMLLVESATKVEGGGAPKPPGPPGPPGGGPPGFGK